MRIKALLPILVVAFSLASGSHSRAQILQQQSFPNGIVGWGSSAPLCRFLPGSAAGFINYSAPSSVSFATSSYGTIGLICNMPGILNRLTPGDMNAIAFTFSNPNGIYGCSASVQLVDRTTATPVYSWTTNRSLSYIGIWTANAFSPTAALLAQNHTYDVEIYLSRPQSAVNLCSPIGYAVFLEDSIQ